MSAIMIVNVALAGINTLLALTVLVTYWRTHREVPSPFTLSLLLFAGFLLLFNGTIVYHFVTMMPTFDTISEVLLLIESLLQTGAVASLAYAATR